MTPEHVLKKMGLELAFTFVPFNESRSKGQDQPNLNWKVNLERVKLVNGGHFEKRTKILAVDIDYSAGQGHCPSYEQNPKDRHAQRERISAECRTGFAHGWSFDRPNPKPSKKIKPKLVDVVFSLLMDSDVLNTTGFADWCDNYGYGHDSIKARQIYDDCLETALQFTNALTDQELRILQTVFQDY